MVLKVKEIDAFKPKDAPFKKSDGGGMYLLVQPAGGKLWQMGYRFGGKQKTYSIGTYPEVSLAEARKKREDARRQLANGVDPMAAKMAAKVEREEAKTFGAWADEWLAKQRAGNKTEKTLDGNARHIRTLKARYAKTIIEDIKRADVLAFLRTFEIKKKLETRDRVRAIGEKVCSFADDEEGNGDNPFRPFPEGKLLEKKTTPRPAFTKPVDVARLFKIMTIERKDTLFDDLVGLALRFLALTAVRPGELATAEWTDIDLDGKLWTIPAPKMKMRKEHAVPLSKQAIAILERIREMTGKRGFVFSCGKDAPLSESALAKRLRFLGYDTKAQHCPHGYRSTFSTLMNAECSLDDVKLWNGDLIELQLAHIEESGVKAIYNRTGTTSLIGARAKLMQHWADRIDAMVGGDNVVDFKAA